MRDNQSCTKPLIESIELIAINQLFNEKLFLLINLKMMELDMESVCDILETSPEVVKVALEAAIKGQKQILEVAEATGMKVSCELVSHKSKEEVPNDQIIMIEDDYQHQVQSTQITVLDEPVDDEFIRTIKDHLDVLIKLNENFDNITAEDIFRADEF